MLFHVKQIAFERECHSNARAVRTVMADSNAAAHAGAIKKAARWPPL